MTSSKRAAALFLTSVLGACGGGGDSAPPSGDDSALNTAPTVQTFSVDPVGGTGPWTVVFRLAALDADADPLVCDLDIDGNGSYEQTGIACSAEAAVQHTYTLKGTYVARVRVGDGKGGTATATRVVNLGATATSRWVSGYYVGYQRDLYPPEAIDFSAMSHIVVGRVRPLVGGGLATNFDIDDVQGPLFAKDLTARAKAAGKKSILMVGGAGEHDGWVSAAAPANRAAFVARLLQTMDELGFDGLDIDWEPIEEADKPHLKALAQDLRAARPGMVLTIPIGWINRNFPEQAEPYYAEIAPYFDQINIMSYDMASGYWGWNAWHSSAVYGAGGMTPSSIESSVDAWLNAGVPAAKLGIGIGFYGSCWRGVTEPNQSTVNVNTGGLPLMGNSDNDMSYANIMTRYYSAEIKKWDDNAKAPYLSSATAFGPQNCNFVSYEDEQSIAEKGAFVQSRGLGGAIVWTINQGYVPSKPAGQRDPLLQAVKSAFNP